MKDGRYLIQPHIHILNKTASSQTRRLDMCAVVVYSICKLSRIPLHYNSVGSAAHLPFALPQ